VIFYWHFFFALGDVKFNEPLREAVAHNLVGTKAMMQLCQDMPHLVSLVHVSTAYAFCQYGDIEEKIYPMKCQPEDVIQTLNALNDQQLDEWVKNEHVLEGRPNYYTFAKALAEHIVLQKKGDIPVAIVRPSIVLSTYEEPVPGWIDTFNGPGGVGILGSLGIMRIGDYEIDNSPSFTPVDFCVNLILAAAWYAAKTR